jgi:hypothetical protein
LPGNDTTHCHCHPIESQWNLIYFIYGLRNN